MINLVKVICKFLLFNNLVLIVYKQIASLFISLHVRKFISSNHIFYDMLSIKVQGSNFMHMKVEGQKNVFSFFFIDVKWMMLT